MNLTFYKKIYLFHIKLKTNILFAILFNEDYFSSNFLLVIPLSSRHTKGRLQDFCLVYLTYYKINNSPTAGVVLLNFLAFISQMLRLCISLIYEFESSARPLEHERYFKLIASDAPMYPA